MTRSSQLHAYTYEQACCRRHTSNISSTTCCASQAATGQMPTDQLTPQKHNQKLIAGLAAKS
jgi:hypothetical protein